MSPPPPVRFNEPEPPAHAQTGGGGRIRTYEGVSRQIYSLLPLTAWVPLRENEPRIVISARAGVNVAGAVFAGWRSPGAWARAWSGGLIPQYGGGAGLRGHACHIVAALAGMLRRDSRGHRPSAR